MFRESKKVGNHWTITRLFTSFNKIRLSSRPRFWGDAGVLPCIKVLLMRLMKSIRLLMDSSESSSFLRWLFREEEEVENLYFILKTDFYFLSPFHKVFFFFTVLNSFKNTFFYSEVERERKRGVGIWVEKD